MPDLLRFPFACSWELAPLTRCGITHPHDISCYAQKLFPAAEIQADQVEDPADHGAEHPDQVVEVFFQLRRIGGKVPMYFGEGQHENEEEEEDVVAVVPDEEEEQRDREEGEGVEEEEEDGGPQERRGEEEAAIAGEGEWPGEREAAGLHEARGRPRAEEREIVADHGNVMQENRARGERLRDSWPFSAFHSPRVDFCCMLPCALNPAK